MPTVVSRLANFVCRASLDRISEEARRQIKIRVLDSLGCAIGALRGEVPLLVRDHVAEFSPTGPCTLIGGGSAAPDLAAFYNGALVRYLDFNDSYLAKGETCHPSDNFAPVLAACEHAGGSGGDLLTALAVAYQVQCRLSDEAPVRSRGFDHTTQGSCAVAAGVSRALGLDPIRTANAISIAGTAFNALRVTRTGSLSHWKGLAYPNTAFGATHAAFLARRGITGPPEVFEGNKGFMEAIAGRFEIEWEKEDLERVNRTILKKYNAEIHSQSVLEAVLELVSRHRFPAAAVERVEVKTFDVAYHIIGGGEEGDKTLVRTKEEADHSLQYMVAVAILDGQVYPPQYHPQRILREDVQALLRKVVVRPDEEFSRRFPAEVPCRVTVFLSDGTRLGIQKNDYEGFLTRPMSWEMVAAKFEALSAPHAGSALRRDIVQAVGNMESIGAGDLTGLLAQVGSPERVWSPSAG